MKYFSLLLLGSFLIQTPLTFAGNNVADVTLGPVVAKRRTVEVPVEACLDSMEITAGVYGAATCTFTFDKLSAGSEILLFSSKHKPYEASPPFIVDGIKFGRHISHLDDSQISIDITLDMAHQEKRSEILHNKDWMKKAIQQGFANESGPPAIDIYYLTTEQ